MNLYASRHFSLFEIRRIGKKNTRAILCFKGLPSPFGQSDEVVALEDGIVLDAGRVLDSSTRGYRRGIFVTVSGRDGAVVIYGRLQSRSVKPGDYIFAGQPLGVEGDTGAGLGKYLTIEIRRNNRRIDACGYLGIKPEPSEYIVPLESPADAVCRICGLPADARRIIDSSPSAEHVWQQLLINLNQTEAREHRHESRFPK